MKIKFVFILILISGSTWAQQQFHNLESLFSYADQQHPDLVVNRIRETQAQKSETAAKWGILNPQASLPASFTHYTNLPVTFLPAEVFGGDPGETVEIQTGIPYTTTFSQNLEFQVVNPGGWANHKLAQINTKLSESNTELTRQIIHESIADVYYNIITLDRQKTSTQENLSIADSIFSITQLKYDEGLINQQNLNNARLTQLNTAQSLQQIDYLIDDAYITLKTLLNIPSTESLVVTDQEKVDALSQPNEALVNYIGIDNKLLQQQYAFQNYKKSKATLYPSVSLFGGNSFQLNSQDFTVLSGDWINTNYVGVQLSINIPNAGNINSVQQSKLEYEIASKELDAQRLEAQLERDRLNGQFSQAIKSLEIQDEVFQINQDTYNKNFNLYQEGLLPLDTLLDSYNNLVNAQYNLNAALVEIDLVSSKITINNKFK